jgi:hypothetical protein
MVRLLLFGGYEFYLIRASAKKGAASLFFPVLEGPPKKKSYGMGANRENTTHPPKKKENGPLPQGR